MIAAGVGFNSAVRAEDIAALVRDAAVRAGVAFGEIKVLATLDRRVAEAPFAAAAALLALPAAAVCSAELARVSGLVATHSARVLARFEVGSIAEAAALAAVGRNPRLILPRIAQARVTCALAQGDGR